MHYMHESLGDFLIKLIVPLVLPVSSLQLNTTHDSIYQRLILINDPAEAMEERHRSSAVYCTGP